MAKPLLYDSILVHYLARELHERLRGRRLRQVRLDSEHRRFTLELDDQLLVWELHPTRGWIRRVGGGPDGLPREAAEGWGGRRIRTQRRPRVRGVEAPPDERILEIEIDAGGPDRASRFVVELMTNQWNVLALGPDRRILSALRTREGSRTLRTGQPYEPPRAPAPREGLERPVSRDRLTALIEAAATDQADPVRAIVRSLAWTSPLNARPIVRAFENDGPAAAFAAYSAVAERPAPRPRLLDDRGRAQPYPLPLPGVPGEPAASLLAAIEAAATAPPTLAPEVRTALEERLERVRGVAARLRAEAESAPEAAARLRARADLLMARLHAVPRGARTVELEDFEGGSITLELDPSLSAPENAEALYDRARKRERAARRLPARARAADDEAERLADTLRAIEDGSVDPAELARWLDDVRPEEPGGEAGERLPYRRLETSGGLEVRVGRSGRANDELTFHHSAPDDIWLHARDAAGAHVILRWGDRDRNPPRQDLLEAAVLAAVNSRARTSGTVPVDWTRRKYVRSPRNAPPGAVIPDRVSTLFVEPDPGIEARLRH